MDTPRENALLYERYLPLVNTQFGTPEPRINVENEFSTEGSPIVESRATHKRGKWNKGTVLILVLCILLLCVVLAVSIADTLRSKARRRTTRMKRLQSNKQISVGHLRPSPSLTSYVLPLIRDSIFVSIPSYRDPDVGNTLLSLFSRAAFPDRVFIGLCDQRASGDPDPYQLWKHASESIIPSLEFDRYAHNVAIWDMNHTDATGPCFARELIEKHLYQGQRYVLFVDSHTRVCSGWDEHLIADLEQTGDPKAILSCYPDTYSFEDESRQNLEQNKDPGQTTFCVCTGFDDDGFPAFGQQKAPVPYKRPQINLFWSANFSFSSSQLIKDVPYLTHVPFLFFGEQPGMQARYYTHGYTCYAPKQSYVYCTFDRSRRSTFWELMDSDAYLEKQESVQRVQALLGLRAPSEQQRAWIRGNSLGQVRSLSGFWRHIGINPATREVTISARLGVQHPVLLDEVHAKYGSLDAFHKASNTKA